MRLNELVESIRDGAGLNEGVVDLTTHARNVFRLGAEDGDYERATRETALIVGKHAKKLGMSKLDVRKWLQDEYGATFVRGANLKPPYSLKEVFRFIEKGMR